MLDLLADAVPESSARLLEPGSLLIMGGVCGIFLFLLIVVFLRRGKKADAPKTGLEEDLGAYPPPPPRKSSRQLIVQSRRGRLRLVVLAPVGKRDLSEHGEPEELLNKVVRGLGDIAKEDKPRIRVWPPQLSSAGFAPSFIRNTLPPKEQASNWILVAGPARAGDLPILLGLAVWCEEPGKQTQLTVEPHQWAEVLRVEL